MIFDQDQEALVLNLRGALSRMCGFSRFFYLPVCFYVYGSVGRGKTTIIRFCLEQLSIRYFYMHYEKFMLDVYTSFSTNRVDKLIGEITSSFGFIWIDEIQFRDATEASTFIKIIKKLLTKKMNIIFTGNAIPYYLFSNIETYSEFENISYFFKKKFQCLELKGKKDYRASVFSREDSKQHFFLKEQFNDFSSAFDEMCYYKNFQKKEILYNHRKWEIEKTFSKTAWLTFEDVLILPRSSVDYRVLCENFDTIFMSTIPVFNINMGEEIERFIILIDLIYEKNINLFLCCEERLDNLFHRNFFKILPLKRTYSRLFELCFIHIDI